MANESPISFDELSSARQQLRDFCSAHYRSLAVFRSGISYKLYADTSKLGKDARHLSSTATCIDSLADSTSLSADAGYDLNKLGRDFALSALRRPHSRWLSDGSAAIYCRCRTLPVLIHYLPRYQKRIQEHLTRILYQLAEDPSRMAVGEASRQKPGPDNWYRPNAFHTYWTLRLLDSFEQVFPKEFLTLAKSFENTRFNITRLRQEMLTWARRTAGHQIALHTQESVRLDSDQLAWSLIIVLKFDRHFPTDLGQQDFIRCALRCLFKQQTSVGIWRTGAPLFHYLKSGNAYCYVFETFSTLFKTALTTRLEGSFLRRELYLYVRNLLNLWRYAVSTQIPLGSDARAIGWSSGHRVNHSKPESWATASVFSFAQGLRRLIGIWTREKSASELPVVARQPSDVDALEKLQTRGDTWSFDGKTTAARELMTLFVNPTHAYKSELPLEPDSQPIRAEQARAAILFGPPGTSKTTLVRSLADAIGWDYVELHASHFVAEGLPNVQRTADSIFHRLAELDRTVILFDEIDELVRAREKEADAFGRFLTTSMLPKLAQLWEQRKVMYFVATNHIRFFDPAVTRAQRFDALIHVTPPSFEKKIMHIKEKLRRDSFVVKAVTITKLEIEEAVQAAAQAYAAVPDTDPAKTSYPLPNSCVLAKFLLLRWDQLSEVISKIEERSSKSSPLRLTTDLFGEILAKIKDPFTAMCKPFDDFVISQQYEVHDFDKIRVYGIEGMVGSGARLRGVNKIRGQFWYIATSYFGADDAAARRFEEVSPGMLTPK